MQVVLLDFEGERMRIEYLFLKEKDEICSSKEEFIHFLCSNGRITVDKKIIKFENTDINYTISNENVKGLAKEIVFHLTIETTVEKKQNLEEFDSVLRRMNDKCDHLFYIYTIWNDVATDYLERLYPKIIEIEHLLRKIIYLLMIKSVGSSWIEKGTPKEVKEKIEETAKRSHVEQFIEDQLEYADFIQLGNFLFTPYSMNSDMQHLIGELKKAKEEKESGNRIDKIISQYESKSNWERYFSEKINIEGLEEKWQKMYSFRNIVAHAKQISRQDYNDAQKLVNELRIAFIDCLNSVDNVALNKEQTEAIQEVAKETIGNKVDYSKLHVPGIRKKDSIGTDGIRLEPFVISSGIDYDIWSDGKIRVKSDLIQKQIRPTRIDAKLDGYIDVSSPRQISNLHIDAGKTKMIDVPSAGSYAQVSDLSSVIDK